MKFRKFVLQDYRAITGPLEINVEKDPLVPIIGINESGKTTILQAIFAFDFHNDAQNDKGRHLRDTRNLYGISDPAPKISAELEIAADEAADVVNELEHGGQVTAQVARLYRRRLREFPESILITRDLRTKKYSVSNPQFVKQHLDDAFARKVVHLAPFILYFDDFRDSVDERVEIPADQDELTGWLEILEQLFKRTDESFSVFALGGMDERQRKSVLAKVNKHLNNTLTREWQTFQLDGSEALEISIEYEQEPKGQFLKLEIIETVGDGDRRFFYIRDRSKGFYWFFNFVMKLEFNPKIITEQNHNTIYLLDEPGSYLHASAQSKLCRKLRQLSRENTVLYCTHSHYLLDPDVIPFSTIKVADKDESGNIRLTPIHEHPGSMGERRAAFQPVIDALQIKPFLFDLTVDSIIIAEGMYDYYCLEMFKGGRNVSVLPSVGADSIPFYVSLLIATGVRFCALWDNDETGRKARAKATQVFGVALASNHFFLLPSGSRRAKNRIMQDLFEGADLRMIRSELSLPQNSAFQKTITGLFYDSRREEVLRLVSRRTKDNFSEVFDSLPLS